jgi:4-amino-4-deoxy-L-arabinose transferase-like glycosyltransferase
MSSHPVSSAHPGPVTTAHAPGSPVPSGAASTGAAPSGAASTGAGTGPSPTGPATTGPSPTGPATTGRSGPGPGRPARVGVPRLGVALVAAAAFGLEMAVSGRYGYHRDELYFLAAGQHPAFGYVDQPPLTPLLARLDGLVFGNTLVGLRLLPALALSAVVLLTAGMSRILGAGRAGQLVAALCAASCAMYLAAMHLFSTTVPDFVAWAGVCYLVLRLLASGQPRWWLAIGAAAGLAAEAKWMIGVLLAGLAAGFVLTPQRRLLRSWYLLAGLLLAAALAAPDLIWQASHGWPNLGVFSALHTDAGHNRAVYWLAQVVYTGLALTPVWLAGLWWGLRDPAARPFRPAIIGAAVAIVIPFLAGGKPYYPGGGYTLLLAAGSVPTGRWLAGGAITRLGRWRLRWRPASFAAGMAVTAGLAAVTALPVLPAATLRTVPLQKINYDLGEQVGWPREVALIAREYRALPPAVRAQTALLAGNYGEAGAVDRYGPALGLPAAYSGHNNFWLWGPPPAADRDVLAIGVDPGLLRREFAQVRRVATYWNGLGVADDEQGTPVYLATGLKGSWAAAWTAFRDYA